MKCWTLTDGKRGCQRQVWGLAKALGVAYEDKVASMGRLGAVWPQGCHWGVLSLLSLESDLLQPPWPDLLIAAGRRVVPLALAIRKASQGKTQCIYLQKPAVHPDRFDWVIAPEHDRLSGKNVLSSLGTLHDLNAADLMAAKEAFQAVFEPMPAPRVAVILGGSTKHYRFTETAARQVAAQLITWTKRNAVSLCVATSRRTGKDNETVFSAAFSTEPNITFFAAEEKPNPYFGLLAWADTFIVSSDSTNLISEACFTGKPVYLLRFPAFSLRPKIASFIDVLQQQGYVRWLEQSLDTWSAPSLQEAKRIAAQLLPRL